MKANQKERIRDMFLKRPNEWVSLLEILGLYIAQYNARIYELRRDGMNIENKIQVIDGSRNTWFRYIPTIRKDLF